MQKTKDLFVGYYVYLYLTQETKIRYGYRPIPLHTLIAN
jgi:hypothetical protein